MKTKTLEPAAQTLADFIAAHGITMHVESVAKNPHMESSPEHPMDHWYCTFANAAGNRMSVHFSTGIGLRRESEHVSKLKSYQEYAGHRERTENPHKLRAEYEHYKACRMVPNAPTAADVLNCLASDAAGVENARSFEDWCADYGYDTDSRKAEKTFRVCEQQRDSLKGFIGGPDAFEGLLFRMERL